MNRRPIHQMTIEPPGTLNALEYLLLGDLRELLEEPETAQTRHALPVLLNGLLDNRWHHSQLKGNGASLSDVLEKWPNRQSDIDLLRCERATCYSALETLRSQILRGLLSATITNKLRHDVQHVLRLVVAISQHQTRPRQTAFDSDVGGEGDLPRTAGRLLSIIFALQILQTNGVKRGEMNQKPKLHSTSLGKHQRRVKSLSVQTIATNPQTLKARPVVKYPDRAIARTMSDN